MDKRLRGIFQTDDGADIRATYREAILSGMSEDEAEQLTVSDLPTENVWVILALVEWEIGRLSEKAKQNALERLEVLLEKNGDSNSSKAERLNLVRETLLSPMPEKKKLRTPWYAWDCPWNIGDVVQFKILYPKENNPFYGAYVLLQVVGKHKPHPGKLPYGNLTVALYDFVSSHPIKPLLTDKTPVPALKRMDFIKVLVEKKVPHPYMGISLVRSKAKEHEMIRISDHPLDGNPVFEIPLYGPKNATFELEICAALSEKYSHPVERG